MAAATVVAVVVGSILATGQVQLPTAEAAVSTDSKITVKWTGDDSAASRYQPKRATDSVHSKDFENLSITVSQTAGVIDQAIRVSVSGFAGTTSSSEFGTNAQNFMQAMQCWGSDPAAKDFRETCQWGGRYTTNNGLGSSVYFDNVLRVGSLDLDTRQPTNVDVPFRTPDGESISGKPQLVGGKAKYAILDFFSPSTTNEVTSTRVGADGEGYFDFETQSADQAPQLGCGTPKHLRCWLVVVPRGTVYGGSGDTCSLIRDPDNNYDPYRYGQRNAVQAGSPLNPNCDYWDNRMVVPLDFSLVGSKCAKGSAEVRVIGSQLMVGAMSSWQPSLCETVRSTFSFSTNPDSVARGQLIDPGANSPNIAYTGFPVSSGELLTDYERDYLAKTKLSYAPVAVSAVVIAFIAEFDNGRQESLVISPRILAKILTQSYKFTVPFNTSDPSRSFAHLGPVNQKYGYLFQDPEFQKLNPDNFNQFVANPAVLLPGPSGADAIRQVWRWILADKEAVAFLNGAEDSSGMTINPYYRPKGDSKATVPWWLDADKKFVEAAVQRAVGLSNLDGSPQKLSQTSLDTFPKNDESLVPLKPSNEFTRFDSIQFSPYTDNLLSGARQAFRADPNSKTTWDPQKLNASGIAGDWVGSGAQPPGRKFMITITDSPSAARYGLSTAALLVPNSTIAVRPELSSLAAALTALRATSLDSVKQVDPAQVSSESYPLTMVTYAAVNLSKASPAARVTIADMLKQVTTEGQVRGAGQGQLPAGYLPLSTELKAQAATSVSDIRSYVAPPPTSRKVPEASNAGQPYLSEVDDLAQTPKSVNVGDMTSTPGVDTLPTARTESASASSALGSSGLIIALIVAIAGTLFAPWLLRGRGFF